MTSTVSRRVLLQIETTSTESPYDSVAFRPATYELAVAEKEDRVVRLYDLASLVSRGKLDVKPLRARVVGSMRHRSKQDNGFIQACRQIGEELARRGHTLVVSSADEATADYPACLGYVGSGKGRRVVFARPNDTHKARFIDKLENSLRKTPLSLDPPLKTELVGAIVAAFDADSLRSALRSDLSRALQVPDLLFATRVQRVVDLAEKQGRMTEFIGELNRLPRSRQLAKFYRQHIRPKTGVDFVVEPTKEEAWTVRADAEILQGNDLVIAVGGGATDSSGLPSRSSAGDPGHPSSTVWRRCEH